MRIKNKHYRRFLDKGEIELIEIDDLETVLNNIKGKHKIESRALVILLYYTGARMNEALDVKAKDITKKDSYIRIFVKGSKRGNSRFLHLPLSKKFVTELYKYAMSMMHEAYLFYTYKGSYMREIVKKDKETGEIKKYMLEETSDKLRYHFKKWFGVISDDPIPPYFLRHNRFSMLAMKGASEKEMQMWKGAKSTQSVACYTHLSARTSKKVGRLL